MVKNEHEKKLTLIEGVILLDNQFSELISRYFSEVSKQDLLKKTLIQDLRVGRKKEIIKSILGQFPSDVSDVEDWNKCAQRCIQIRNAVAHNLPDGKYYTLNLDGKNGKFSVGALLKIFSKSWKVVNPPIISILNKIKEDNLLEDVIIARIYLRNYKEQFADIYSIEIEDSEGDTKELTDFPDNQYSLEEYKEEVEKDVREWLLKKGINSSEIEFETELDWFEKPDD